MLTDAQIDRYSRQIVLPEVGGIGQERLLESHLTVIGEIEDLSPVLEYLTGAGVGTIGLECLAGSAAFDQIRDAMAALNPDVRIEPAASLRQSRPTLLIVAGSDRALEAAKQANRGGNYAGLIFARLGEPVTVAVLSSRPPCLACADDLLRPVRRGALAAPVSMFAAAEALKLLLAGTADSRLIQFTDLNARATTIASESAHGCPVCAAQPSSRRL